MRLMAVRRAGRKCSRIYREVRLVALALSSPRHPVFAHMVVTRRCNLACTYCSEFDTVSKPVPTAELIRRADLLAALGTTAITLTGGETLLHPELEKVIAHIRSRGLLVFMITNGYLLSQQRIEQLNRAGLDRMQISIDNVLPDAVSKKSLKTLDLRLQWLSQRAEFAVNVHSVVGAGTEKPEDALVIQRRAVDLGLASTTGILHDPEGQMGAIPDRSRRVLEQIDGLRKRSVFSFARHAPWRKNLIEGKPNDWHCSAGGRHLYICEDGLVHYCMSQRGRPAIPLASYTQEHMDREAKRPKSCAPYCTIFCVQRVALLDRLRERPGETLGELFPGAEGSSPAASQQFPLVVRVLNSAFAQKRTSTSRQFLRKTALRLLRIEN